MVGGLRKYFCVGVAVDFNGCVFIVILRAIDGGNLCRVETDCLLMAMATRSHFDWSGVGLYPQRQIYGLGCCGACGRPSIVSFTNMARLRYAYPHYTFFPSTPPKS